MTDPVRPVAHPPVDPDLRRDAEAAVAARRELGPEYQDHVAAGLADRVEELVAYRTAEQRTQGSVSKHERSLERAAQTQSFVLGLASLGAGIPITAISANLVDPGLVGVAVCWLGIVGVNVANALGRRRR